MYSNLEKRTDQYRPAYRSRGERVVGRLLEDIGVSATYERPTLVNDSGKLKIWYPDFALDKNIVLEYFGLAGNEDYDKGTRHKLKVYENNGITVIPVYPEDLQGLDWRDDLVRKIAEYVREDAKYLKNISDQVHDNAA